MPRITGEGLLRIGARAPIAAGLLVVAATAARAAVPFGPWTFDDRAFGDRAEQLEPGPVQLYCGAVDVNDALTGITPDRQLVNIGYSNFANDFAIYFDDLPAVNEPGPDLVFFESAFSTEGFMIAVRPVGGTFTPLRAYAAGDFIDTGESYCDVSVLMGLPIDLDDFGFPAGAVADAIRFQSLPAISGVIEGDPVMAAVLGSGCPPLPDSDGDGIGDACDCAPFSSGPGEPSDVHVLADRRTFTFAPDPANPGITARLLRGDLTYLRATADFDLVTADEGPVADVLDDPTPPARLAPLYYLVTAVDCDGVESSLGRNSFGIERMR